MSFKSKKSVGDFGENHVQSILNSASIRNWLNEHKENRSKLIEWDIGFELDNDEFLIEVKFDRMEAKTGNIAIEYYNTKQAKPSGIMATKSHLWVVVLQDPVCAYVANTAQLREYYQKEQSFRNIACGGDMNAAMKLYPREQILNAVFVLLEKENLHEILRIALAKK